MFGTGPYPITLVEMQTYSVDADNSFSWDEHEQLKQFLALHPTVGDVIADSGGVRTLDWPLVKASCARGSVVVYYFKDLGTPLFLIALYAENEEIDLSETSRAQMEKLVNELVAEYGKKETKLAPATVTAVAKGA